LLVEDIKGWFEASLIALFDAGLLGTGYGEGDAAVRDKGHPNNARFVNVDGGDRLANGWRSGDSGKRENEKKGKERKGLFHLKGLQR
jgi:hypothetical protein